MNKYGMCGFYETEKMLRIMRSLIKENSYLQKFDDELRKLETEYFSLPKNANKAEKNVFSNKVFALSQSLVGEFWKFGNYKDIVSSEVYRYMLRRIITLKRSDAWRDKKDSSANYNREDKEALKAMIFFILLIHNQEVKGKKYNISACIGYILQRIIRTSYLGDSKPETKQWFAQRVPDYEQVKMTYVINEALKDAPFMFVSEVFYLASQISQEEEYVFKVAKTITNKIEFDHIRNNIFPDDVAPTEKQISDDWETYNVDDFVSKDLYNLFEKMSWSKNMFRWQGYLGLLNCSILTHMLETAVLAWLMSFEHADVFQNVMKTAERAFVVGLFHDLSEVYTGDMSSLVKDGIICGDGQTFRPLTEEQEREVIQNEFLPKLAPQVAEYFKKNIDFESQTDHDFYRLVKKADYFSADIEIVANIICGSRDIEFLQIIRKSYQINRTPETTKVLGEYLKAFETMTFMRL